MRLAALLALAVLAACTSEAPPTRPAPPAPPPPAPAPSPPVPAPVATPAETAAPVASPAVDGFQAMKAVMRVAGRAWTKLDPGSFVESKTASRAPNGEVWRGGAEKQALTARDGERVTIRFELGQAARTFEGEIHAAPKDDALAAALAQATETVEVPGGTFECRRYRAVYRTGTLEHTVDLWIAPEVPVPVKTLETSEREHTETILERCNLVRRPVK